MNWHLKLIFKLLLLTLFVGCAQKTSSPVPDANVRLGALHADKKLDLTNVKNGARAVFADGTSAISSADLFRMSGRLIELGQLVNRRPLTVAGRGLVSRFYANASLSTSVDPEQSPYLEAALGEKWPILETLLANKISDINKSISAVDQTSSEAILTIPADFESNLSSVLSQIIQFLPTLADGYRARGATEEVVLSFEASLRTVYIPKLQALGKYLARLDAGAGLAETLKIIQEIIPQLTTFSDRPLSLSADLDSAKILSQQIEGIKTKEDVLGILIDIWSMLDASQRRNIFYKQNPSLHDFLAGCTPAQLALLKEGPNAFFHPELYYARNWEILPYIANFGVEKFRDRLDSAAGTFARSKLKDSLVAQTAALGAVVGAKVKEELIATRDQLPVTESVKKDYFTTMALAWAKGALFPDAPTTAGAEASRVQLHIKNGKMDILPDLSLASSDSVATSALAAGLSAQVAMWPGLEDFENISFSSPKFFRMVLSQVNKLVSFGGYHDYQNQVVSPFHFSLYGGDELMDLREIDALPVPFAIPDAVALTGALDVDRLKTEAQAMYFSAGTQAEILRASARAALYFRDWIQNGFDEKLGKFKLGELIQGIDPQYADMVLFPKDRLFELSLGVGDVVFKNLTGPRSNLVLFYGDGRRVPGDQMSKVLDDAKAHPANGFPVSAAIVDMTMKGAGATVRTIDVAEFILAVDEFMDALSDVEKSNSEVIRDPKFLATLKDCREKLALLMMTMANFLSGQMQDAQGRFNSSLDFSAPKHQTAGKLRDQLLAIRALMTASNRLGAKVYQWAALDGYFAMNSYFWRSKKGYYSDSELAPSLLDYVDTLSVLARLRSLVPETSRPQLLRILNTQIEPVLGL